MEKGKVFRGEGRRKCVDANIMLLCCQEHLVLREYMDKWSESKKVDHKLETPGQVEIFKTLNGKTYPFVLN